MSNDAVRTEDLDLTRCGWWDVISADGAYRYQIGHRFAPGPLCGFSGINPSTAVAGQPDATTRKWDGFSKRWGFGGWIGVNPFALRSKDVHVLMKHRDPVGPQNDEQIREAMEAVSEIVVCWGNPPSIKLVPRLIAVARMLGTMDKPLRQVGALTNLGQPRHLLMESYATRREVFEPPNPPRRSEDRVFAPSGRKVFSE